MAFKSEIPDAQIDAVRAALHAPSREAEEWIAAAFRSGDAAVRLAAVESGVSRGSRPAWEMATRLAQQRDVGRGPVSAAARDARHGRRARDRLRGASLSRRCRRTRSGRSATSAPRVPPNRAWRACKYEKLARACGEAYCWITGADLERDRLAVEETPPEVPAFEEDDLDANLVPPPESLWPLPDADAARRDWLARRPASPRTCGTFTAGPPAPTAADGNDRNGPDAAAARPRARAARQDARKV